MRWQRARGRCRQSGPPGVLAVPLAALLAVAVGAGPLRVERVQVPAGALEAVFPKDTELRFLPETAFEDLVRAARAARAARDRGDDPSPVRARHDVSWEDGVLVGRSELSLAVATGPGRLVELTPWTPAVERMPKEGAGVGLRATARGRTALRVEARGPSRVVLAWRLRARPGSSGHVFDLGLPRCAASRLSLDLPAGLVPEGPAGFRPGSVGGIPAGRRTWLREAPAGDEVLELRLADRAERERAIPEAWVQGPTEIDVQDAVTTWRTRWSVELSPAAPRDLDVAMAPELEVVAVEGPAVVRHAVSRPGGSTARLVVTFAEGVTGPTPITIRALAHPPVDGAWRVPFARPSNASWTGGRVLIRLLGPARTLAAVRGLDGAPVVPRPEELEGLPRGAGLLAFGPSRADAVAELTFRRTEAEIVGEVRGRVLIGRERPRLEALLSLGVERGGAPSLVLDLPESWTPDRLEQAESRDPVPWQVRPRSGGGLRLIAPLAPSPGAGKPLVLRLTALADRLNPAGGWALPRVVPAGIRLSDERWLIAVDPGLAAVPTQVSGLAWMEPDQVGVEIPAGQWPILAWRWIDAAGQGRLEVRRAPERRSSQIVELARVEPDRLELDAAVRLDGAAPEGRGVPVHYDGPPPAAPPEWAAEDGAGPAPPVVRPLAPGEHARAGLPEGGMAWELPATRARAATYRVRLRIAWTGSGRVPLLRLPGTVPQRGVVLIAVHQALKSRAVADGVRRIDSRSALLDALPGAGLEPPDPGRFRLLYGFGMDGPGDPSRHVTVSTERLECRSGPGLVLEAILRGTATAGGSAVHGLELSSLLAPGQDALPISLPERAILERAVVKGRDVIPVLRGSLLMLPLPPARRSPGILSARLEYRVPEGETNWPTWPRLEWPCLATTWLVTATPGAEIRPRTPDLIPQGPALDRQEVLWSWWRGPGTGVTGAPLDPRSIAEWNRSGCLLPQDPRTLGGLLTQWDAGPRPLVVDRLALRDAGVGPATLLRPGTSPTAGKPATAWDLFRGLGLTLEPRGECLLVTTSPDRTTGRAPAGPEDGATAVRTAAGRGSDPTDRFQSVVRWGAGTAPEAGAEAVGGRVGSVRGFAQLGYPGAGEGFEGFDPRARWAAGAALGVALLVGGMAIRRRSRARRARFLAVIAAGAVASSRWSPGLAVSLASGALACLGFWIGPALRRRPAPTGPDRTHRPSRIATASLPIGLLAAAASFTLDLMGDEGTNGTSTKPAEDLIIAVSPADELALVVIRRADEDRLRGWADLGAQPRADGAVTVADIEHRVGARAGAVVPVESRLALVLEGDAPGVWELPLGPAREVTGELDGEPIGLEVQPGGRAVRAWVREPGRHTLVVRRQVDLHPCDGGFDLDLPINPAATARVACAACADRIDIVVARGSIRAGPDGTSARLGPVERLRVRWMSGAEADTTPPRVAAEGLLLWDVGPAGDRVHVRLTYHVSGAVSEVRMGLDAGVVVRSAAVPGLVESRLQEEPGGTTWTARVDPPWSGTTSFQLDLWQPRKGSGGARGVPRVEPVGAEVTGWILGFRRPGSWTGRLRPVKGTEALSDDAFARTWGTFPDPQATFAGAIKSAHPVRVEVAAGPAPVRATVRPRVVVKVQPGRLLVTAEAGITEREGQVRELAVRVPDAWRAIRVEAAGLTSWSRPAAGELRLRFDGAGTAARRVRLEGWLPTPGDPLRPPGAMTAPLPWPTWTGLDVEAGELRLMASRALGVRLADAARGVVPTSSPSDGLADPATIDLSYRIGPAVTAPGNLAWTEPASFTKVAVDKLLTVYPGAAVLTAALDYQIQGGPLHAVTFSLPQSWSRRARFACDGTDFALQKDERENTTFWTLRPGRPAWGALRVRIEADRAFEPPDSLSVPEILPRGRGEVTSLLALANATGHPLVTEGEGIAAVGASSARIEALLPFHGIPCTTYRITRDGWRLSVRQPTASPAATAGILLADHTGVVAPDGASWGLARFDLGATIGPLLPFRFPVAVEVLGALVDGLPTQVLRDPAGTWYLPVPDGLPCHAELAWTCTAGPGGASLLPLPGTDPPRAPTLVTIFAPEGGTIRGSGPQLVEASGAALELERVGARARDVTDRANRLDSSSAADRSRLLGALVQFELACRVAERAARFTSPAPASGLGPLERLRAIRGRLEDNLRGAGLGEYVQSARCRVGTIPGEARPELAAEPILPPALSLPRLGIPRTFCSPGLSGRDGLVLRWSPDRPGGPRRTWLEALLPPGLAGLVLIAGLLLARAADRLRADRAGIGAIGLTLLGLVLFPLAGAVLAASLALGWLARPRAGAGAAMP